MTHLQRLQEAAVLLERAEKLLQKCPQTENMTRWGTIKVGTARGYVDQAIFKELDKEDALRAGRKEPT